MPITHGRVGFRAVKTLSGYSIPAWAFPEAAAQTFKVGAPLVLTGGYLVEAGAAPALVVGIATRDGQNGATAGAKAQLVILANPDTVFLGNLDDASGTFVSLATHRGAPAGIAKHGGTGKWYLDAAAAAKQVTILDFWDGVIDNKQAAVGDTMHPVYFQFAAAKCQLLA